MKSIQKVIILWHTCVAPNNPPDGAWVVAPNNPVDVPGLAPNVLVFVAPKLLAGGLKAELVPNADPVPPNPVKPVVPVAAT